MSEQFMVGHENIPYGNIVRFECKKCSANFIELFTCLNSTGLVYFSIIYGGGGYPVTQWKTAME